METSILAPVLYLTIVVGGLLTFSSMYRKRNARQTIEPYFPSHPERDAYVTLLQMTDPPAPDYVLKGALIQRACADIRRVVRLREDKPAVQALLQKGSVGDELWASLLAAEKEVEAEILEVMHEANSFIMGWGGFIFNTAGEIVNNENTRNLMQKYPQMRIDAEHRFQAWKKLHPRESAVKAEVKTETPIPSPASSPVPEPAPSNSQLDTPAKLPAAEAVASPKFVAQTLLNGKLAPPTAGNDSESNASMSDGELVSAPGSTAGSPSKPGNKKKNKNKKRK